MLKFLSYFLPVLQLTESQREERKELILTLMLIIFCLIIATLVVMVVIILFRRNKANKERLEYNRRNEQAGRMQENNQKNEVIPAEPVIEKVQEPAKPQKEPVVDNRPPQVAQKEVSTEPKATEKKTEEATPQPSPPKKEEIPAAVVPKPEPPKPTPPIEPQKPEPNPVQPMATSTAKTFAQESVKVEIKPTETKVAPTVVPKKSDAEKTPEEKLKEIQQRLQELKKDPNANKFKSIEEVKKAAGVDHVVLPPKPVEKKSPEAEKPAESKPLSSAAKAEEIRQKIALWAKELKEANESKSASNTTNEIEKPIEKIEINQPLKEEFKPIEPAAETKEPELNHLTTDQIIESTRTDEVTPDFEEVSESSIETKIEDIPTAVPEAKLALEAEEKQESPIRQLIEEISKPDSYYSEILKSASIDLKAKTLTIDGVKMTFTEWIESLESSNE